MVVATAQMAPNLEHLDAPELLEYAVERFHPRLAVACSFQKEASVVLDLILRAAPDARIFTLDTHVLFPETYETWKAVEERYGIEVEVFQGPSLGRQAAEHDLPDNPLHDRGYPTIGCTHCTLPGAGREGRWAGSGKTECGLHA